jgi:hypothetical protein
MEPLRRISSSRKWRLFGIACVRRIWSMAPAPFQRAVEVAERFADRQASDQERAAALPAYSPHATAAEHAAFRAASSQSEIIRLARNAKGAVVDVPVIEMGDEGVPVQRAKFG